MKILFFALFLCMLQPAIATDAFNEQELAALEKIKATVEGRLRYNRVLLSMLNDEDSSPRERLQNYFQETGSVLAKSLKKGSQKKLTDEVVDSLLQMHIGGVQRDINMLNVTHEIFCTVENYETDFRKNLYFLAMDIETAFLKLRKERGQSREILDDFHEWIFYGHMKNCLEDIQLSSHFVHLAKKFQYTKSSDLLGLLYNPESEADDIRGLIDTMRATPEQLTLLTAHKEDYRAHLLLIQPQIRSLRPVGAIENWDNFGEKKQYFDDFFWPRMQVRRNISDLEKMVAETKYALDCTLADFNQKELLGKKNY